MQAEIDKLTVHFTSHDKAKDCLARLQNDGLPCDFAYNETAYSSDQADKTVAWGRFSGWVRSLTARSITRAHACSAAAAHAC